MNKAINLNNVLAPLFLLSLMFLMTGCEGFESYLDTEDPIEEGFILAESQYINAEGGAIILDSMQVIVPPGSFSKRTKLSVYVKPNDKSFGENGLSDLYLLRGLPEKLGSKITIQIIPDGVISGDTLIAIGEMGYASSLDSSHFAFQAHPANINNDWVEITYPIDPGVLKTGQALDGIIIPDQATFILINNYTLVSSSNGHFEIYSPKAVLEHSEKLGAYFEAAFDTCKNMGFSLSGRTWPAPVLIKPANDFIGAYYFFGFKGMTDADLINLTDKGRFTISQDYLTNESEMKATAGHEFLHLVQNLYEFSASFIKEEQGWLKEATAVWIEEKFSTDPYYVSSNIQGKYLLYPLFGWQNKSSDHGYGMSFLIKDIADTYGDASILRIFESIKNGTLPNNPKDPVSALLDEIKEPVETFWHGVIGGYMLGNYYNKKVAFELLDYLSTNLKYNDLNQGNTKRDVTEKHADLSAGVYQFAPNDPDWKDDARVRFSVSDPVNSGLLVYKFKLKKEIVKLGEVFPGGSGKVEIHNLKELQADGYKIMVILSNTRHVPDYLSSREITLTIEVNPPDTEPEYEIICPDEISISYWQYLSLVTTGYKDTLFYIKVKNNEKYRVKYWHRSEFWEDVGDWQDPIPEEFAVTGDELKGMFGQEMKPDSQDSIKIHFRDNQGFETTKSLPFTILPLFEGLQLLDSVYSGSWSGRGHSLVCGLGNLNFTVGGNSYVGESSKSGYTCRDDDGNPTDTSRTFNWQSNLSITANQNELSGTSSIINSYTTKDREGNHHDNRWDEIFITKQFSFNSTMVFSQVSSGEFWAPDHYQMSFGFENMSGTSYIKKVLYRWNKPDSIWTETQNISDQSGWVKMIGTFK
ncbi:MAG: hypothetical protein KAH17_02215 [Bacteroidales bacterium]|nr:hypothetical protein [Bacteroidales bacterium]